MGVNSLPKRRDCDLNPGPSTPESSTLTTRLPSHPIALVRGVNNNAGICRNKNVHLFFLNISVKNQPVFLIILVHTYGEHS